MTFKFKGTPHSEVSPFFNLLNGYLPKKVKGHMATNVAFDEIKYVGDYKPEGNFLSPSGGVLSGSFPGNNDFSGLTAKQVVDKINTENLIPGVTASLEVNYPFQEMRSLDGRVYRVPGKSESTLKLKPREIGWVSKITVGESIGNISGLKNLELHGTETGRLSSKKSNVSNLPRGESSNMLEGLLKNVTCTITPYIENPKLNELMHEAHSQASLLRDKFRSVIKDSLESKDEKIGFSLFDDQSTSSWNYSEYPMGALFRCLRDWSKESGTKGSKHIVSQYSPTRNKYPGKGDIEGVFTQSYLFLDADNNWGDWIKVTQFLDSIKCTYIIQESHNSVKSTVVNKFHVLIPLSKELQLRENYAREYAWVLGILSGCMFDDHYFDPKPNRQNQAIFTPLKTEGCRQAEITYTNWEQGLNWERLLQYTGFNAQEEKHLNQLNKEIDYKLPELNF